MFSYTWKALLGTIWLASQLSSQLTNITYSRTRAVKELLTRNAAKLEDWDVRGLVGSLKLPMAWVNEAKVRL